MLTIEDIEKWAGGGCMAISIGEYHTSVRHGVEYVAQVRHSVPGWHRVIAELFAESPSLLHALHQCHVALDKCSWSDDNPQGRALSEAHEAVGDTIKYLAKRLEEVQR